MVRTLLIGVFVATLLVASQSLSLSHQQVAPTVTGAPATPSATPTTTTTAATTTSTASSSYKIFDYIKGRKMVLNHCFKDDALAPDENTLFTWQDNNLHIEGGLCGTVDCPFTHNGKEFTFSTCTPATTANAQCNQYITRITKSHHLSLVSNLIKFFDTSDISGRPNIVLADKK